MPKSGKPPIKDIIKVYMDQFMNPPTPPSDPSGLFHLFINGGGGTATDTVLLYMTQEQLDAGYDDAISQAFEAWKADTVDPSFVMPKGELDLGAVTSNAGLDPANIAIGDDVENLQIINQSTGTTEYDFLGAGANAEQEA